MFALWWEAIDSQQAEQDRSVVSVPQHQVTLAVACLLMWSTSPSPPTMMVSDQVFAAGALQYCILFHQFTCVCVNLNLFAGGVE